MKPEVTPFSEPFCPRAERRFMADLLYRVSAQPLVSLRTNIRQYPVVDTSDIISKSYVVWKTKGFGEETGLCISGVNAGYLVYHDKRTMRIGRPVSVNGGDFVPEEFYQSALKRTKDGVFLNRLKQIAMQGEDCAGEVLVLLLQTLSYPVDTSSFLQTISREHLVYIPPLRSSEGDS